ncbi:MAG: S41 family peptidase [Gammaproteobacteria bacterium]|nr:S41 family peptidase [Gammaproteobacteria bacterium]
MLVVGTVLGFTVSLGSSVLAERKPAQTVARADIPLSPEYAELLTQVVQRVRAEYVDSVDEQRIVESAIRGILQELDPHSKYLDPEQYEDIRISTTGNYSGVGLDVSLDDGKVTVVSPLDGAPAERAGILPGDVVVSVNEVPVDRDNVEETVNMMRGQPGTQVTLDILRDGNPEPLRFALTRADIHVNTVRSAPLADGFGYIRLTSFSNSTARELQQAAEELTIRMDAPLRGLVLDLRNNPGGVLDAAVDVADLFLDDGLIVRGSGRARQARFERHAAGGDPLENVPLVVLVNGGSASASEIVAGALKDHSRSRLVGLRTYGKGSVQTVMPLGEGSAIKLTTSLYITPSGRSINGIGIEPDVRVGASDPKNIYRGPGSKTAFMDDEQVLEALRVIGYDPEPKVLSTSL